MITYVVFVGQVNMNDYLRLHEELRMSGHANLVMRVELSALLRVSSRAAEIHSDMPPTVCSTDSSLDRAFVLAVEEAFAVPIAQIWGVVFSAETFEYYTDRDRARSDHLITDPYMKDRLGLPEIMVVRRHDVMTTS